jgi:hypothetical protein
VALKLPLSVVIEAIDKLTGPMRKVQRSIQTTFEPVHQLRNSLAGLSEAAGLPALGKAFGTVKDRVADVFQGIVTLARRLFLVGGAGVAAVVGLEESWAHAGEAILATSRKLGLGVQALQELHYAAKQYGVSQEELDAGLTKMSRGIGDAARGQGTLRVAFQRLGIPLRDANGQLIKLEDALPLVADRLNELADDGRRTALTMAIFGRGGAALTPMLRHGSEMIAKMRDEAERLGLVMSDKDVQGAEEFIQAQNRLQGALTGVRNVVASALAPALVDLANKLTTFLVEHKDEISAWARDFAQKLPGAIKELGKAFDELTTILKPLSDTVRLLGENFGYANVALVAFGAYIGAQLIGSVLRLIPALASLIPVLFGVDAALDANPIGLIVIAIAAAIIQVSAMIAIGIELIKHWDKVKQFFIDLWATTKRGFDGMVEVVTNAVRRITSILPDWLVGKGGAIAVNAGAPVGVLTATPARAAGSEAKVSVRFENAPKGTRLVPQGNSGVDLDTSMGYAMMGSGG